MKEIEDRIKQIADNVEGLPVWKDMVDISKELNESLKEYDIIRKIIMNPNDFLGGSVNFYFMSQPEGVFLKLWHDGGVFYISLYRKEDDGFDVQLTNTFNKEGLIPLTDLDEFEQTILNYVANEVYALKNTITLNGATSDTVSTSGTKD